MWLEPKHLRLRARPRRSTPPTGRSGAGLGLPAADRGEGATMAGADRVVTTWRKSSYSAPNGSNCVEVAAATGATPVIIVRDTKNRAVTPLEFSTRAWRHFAATLKRV